MKTLYALRQKLSLTVQESVALGAILSLLFIGFAIREFKTASVPTVRQSVASTPKVNTGKVPMQQAGLLGASQEVQEEIQPVADSVATMPEAEAVFSEETLPEPEAAEIVSASPQRTARRLALSDIVKADDKPTKKDEPVSIPRMNINTATMQQLELLPGVGPSIAERIVAYRTQIKPFDTVEELMEIKGIGDKKFAKMQPYVFAGK